MFIGEDSCSGRGSESQMPIAQRKLGLLPLYLSATVPAAGSGKRPGKTLRGHSNAGTRAGRPRCLSLRRATRGCSTRRRRLPGAEAAGPRKMISDV